MTSTVDERTRPTSDPPVWSAVDVAASDPSPVADRMECEPAEPTEGVNRLLRVGASVLTLGLVVDQLRVVLSFGTSHTDEDQTILWDAGREILAGKLHQPNFFGQTYNTDFEAIPGALLHLAGLAWSTSMPLATSLMVTMAWVVLAVGAHRRGRPILALLALAAPLLMRVQYLLLFDAPRGVASGDLAATVAVAIALASRRPRVRLCSLIALGGLAIQWDMAAALLIVPVLIYVVSADWRAYAADARRTGEVLGIALLPPVAWVVMTDIFYRTHHGDAIAPTVSTVPHWSIFVENIHHLDMYFSFFAPALTPMAGLASTLLLGGFIAIVVIAVRRHAFALLGASCSLVVLVCIALAMQRSTDIYSGLYISGPRLFLPLPFAIWFLALAVSDSSVSPAATSVARVWRDRRTMVAVLALATGSLLASQAAFTSIASQAVNPDVQQHTGVDEANPVQLTNRCAAITKVYDTTGAQLLATINLNVAYGCEAEDGLPTLATNLDRRAWVIQAALEQPVRRILLVDSTCRFINPRAGVCTQERAGTVLLQTPLVPAATSLDKIVGLHVHVGRNPWLSAHTVCRRCS